MTFLSGLTLVFITLKLMGYIAWSWWWVVSPMYILTFLFAVLVYGSYKAGERLVFRRPGRRRPF
jgi:uncharacterized membrane protein YqjE